MIRPLRRRHLWIVAILAVAVLALFFAALAARPERPLQDGLPQGTEKTPAPVEEADRGHETAPASTEGRPGDER